MITISNYDTNGNGQVKSCDFRGLSTDTKPTDLSVGNGSTFIEIDTGKIFLYDAAGSIWYEVGA